MKTVRFIMALHNHQPVGNFHDVFAKGCRRAYQPFLNVLDEFPAIRCVLHYSGPLWEWAERNERSLIDRVIKGAQSGRFELMGGGFGEPILTMLPANDAVGQIKMYRDYLRRRYGVTVRGVWLTERIWEAMLASVLADAGVHYTVVDDFHFKVSGLRDPDLTGYYITEDRGRLLRMFSGSEVLRYSIPWLDPQKTIEYLRGLATEDGRALAVYADDGEKFGLWPETYEHVYGHNWLRDLFRLLDENREWIRFTTFSEALDDLPPKGKIYMADASYREMTEWALPAQAQIEMEGVMDYLKANSQLERARPFFRGGTWRNFKVKYVEAAQMYARMMETSGFLTDRAAAKNLEEARHALYMGQCNCAYWHGVFGGLYLPFLRYAIYEQLLKAEDALTNRHERPGRTVADFDLDGRPEVRLRNADLGVYLKPDRGGALYELDDRPGTRNLTAVMTRRPEAYHQRLIEGVRSGKLHIVRPGQPMENIHGAVRAKEAGLEKLLYYDRAVRESLMDHFYPADAAPEQLMRNETPELGDFVGAEYRLDAPPSRATLVTLLRRGKAGPPGRTVPVDLAKRIRLEDGAIEVRYALGYPEGAPPDTVFGVEFNFGLMAGNAPDRNYFTHARENLGNLSALLRRAGDPALAVMDDWLGLEIWIHADPVAGFWTYPVETVNDSEGGFERVYQSSAIIPFWASKAQPGEEQVVTLTLEVRHR